MTLPVADDREDLFTEQADIGHSGVVVRLGLLTVHDKVFHAPPAMQISQLLNHCVRGPADYVAVLLQFLETLVAQGIGGTPNSHGLTSRRSIAHWVHILPGSARRGAQAPDKVPGLFVGLLLSIGNVAAQQLAEVLLGGRVAMFHR